MAKIQVTNQEEIPAQVMAQAILDLSSAMKSLDRSRLQRRTIVTLIHDQSKISKRTIELVLNNLADLEKDWLKK